MTLASGMTMFVASMRPRRLEACATLLAQFLHQPHHVRLADELAIDLNPLAKRNQMRRGEQAHAQSRRAINAFEHRARRAFAIRAGDVDEAELVLRIARLRGELARVLQPELRAEPA